MVSVYKPTGEYWGDYQSASDKEHLMNLGLFLGTAVTGICTVIGIIVTTRSASRTQQRQLQAAAPASDMPGLKMGVAGARKVKDGSGAKGPWTLYEVEFDGGRRASRTR